MAASALAAVGQVAGNILLGVGRGAVIVRVASVGVVVNLAASVALVYPLGVAGVFWGTLVAAAVTTPWIIAAACRHCDTHFRRFLSEAVAPAVPPVVAELAVLGLVDALGLRPAPTLAIGVPLGAAVAAAATLRWAMPAREVAGLWRALRGGAGSGNTPGAPSGGVGVP
jgi:O-antigen/teichoic acid export membrane protein